MEKTFLALKEGDEIFFTKISNSKVLMTITGSVFKTKIARVVKTCDMTRASLSFQLPINGKYAITVELDKSVYVSYNTSDEVSLDVDVFGMTKEAVLEKTLAIINSRLGQIESIKKKCDANIDDLLIAGAAIEIEQEAINELSLEEAASMAL